MKSTSHVQAQPTFALATKKMGLYFCIALAGSVTLAHASPQSDANLPAPATNQATNQASAKTIPKADYNKDGLISKIEFMSEAERRFKADDQNNDGRLSREERQEARDQRRNERRTHRAQRRFETQDANGDGVISKDEYDMAVLERETQIKTRREARKNRSEANKDTKKTRKAWRKRKGKKSPRRFHADANQDGYISLAEHKIATDVMFSRLDVNADGVLTAGEGRQRRAKRHKFRRQHSSQHLGQHTTPDTP